ncbi:MAG: outer membrane beta-barrel protein [Bacillota bacterium]
MKSLILALTVSLLVFSNNYSQSKFFITGFLESQSGADHFYQKSQFLNGLGLGYMVNKYIDVQTVFSYMGDTRWAGGGDKDYNYIKDAYSVLLGMNIKPLGTIIRNPAHEFGHFSPYLGLSIKRRTIYDFIPENTMKDSEWILSGNAGAEFTLTKLLNVFGFMGLKYLVGEANRLSEYKMKSELAHPSYNWGFGLKVNI